MDVVMVLLRITKGCNTAAAPPLCIGENHEAGEAMAGNIVKSV